MATIISSYLGANSPAGFYSFFDEMLLSTSESWVIKGSPGCGKSTFMKYIAEGVSRKGADVEQFRCASDPRSLDGFLIPKLSAAFVDGTSPHVLEPKYPGAVGNYIDFGQFIDQKALAKEKEKIISLTDESGSYYPEVFRFIKTARDLYDDNLATVCLVSDFDKLSRRFRGVIKREFGKSARKKGTLCKRFLSSISYEGYVSDFSSIENNMQRVYCLESSYGLSRFVTGGILDAALDAGLDAVACYSPLNPEGSPEHVVVPKLSLAFVSSTPKQIYTANTYRNIHLDGIIEKQRLRQYRSRIRFNDKTASCLIDEAVRSLQKSRDAHDKLEAVYNPYIDFDGVMELADHFLSDIRSRV